MVGPHTTRPTHTYHPIFKHTVIIQQTDEGLIKTLALKRKSMNINSTNNFFHNNREAFKTQFKLKHPSIK